MRSIIVSGVHYWRFAAVIVVLAGLLASANAYQHRLVKRTPARSQLAAQILEGAKAQLGTRYDSSYRILGYPGGDMPARTGACTDVVIRSLRGIGLDLQVLVHEDMSANRAAYPRARTESIPLLFYSA